MKKLTLAAMSALLLLGITPGASGGPGPHGISSDNVEHLKYLPFEAATGTGGRIVGNYFYVTSWKTFSIFDVSVPEDPQWVSTTPLGGVMFENEDVATNGKILIFSEELPGDTLYVWDVRDKASPKLISELPGVGEHTMSCILDCKWLYGAYGTIVDLRNPKKPKMAGNWGASGHDVIEVRPGIVLTATDPIQMLDARKDPAHPTRLAVAQPMNEFIHSVQWPRGGADKFMLATGETWVPGLDSQCTDSSAGFSTWDASNYKKTHSFQKIDVFRPTSGNYADGRPAINAPFGCSSHWFQQNPTFKNGGLVAAGFYNHGARFLDVDSKGKIKEVGWFLPHAGGTSGAYWRTNRIVYTVDYQRGMDVLKYTGKL